MKKYLLSLCLIALVVLSIALAAWWNPFSWFDSWNIFHKDDAKIEVLENRVQELESMLRDENNTTAPITEVHDGAKEKIEVINPIYVNPQTLTLPESNPHLDMKNQFINSCGYGSIYCTCLYDYFYHNYNDFEITSRSYSQDDLINAYAVCNARFNN